MTSAPTWLSVLREFGFPILVCVWFMLRLEKRIDKFQDLINKLVLVNKMSLKMIREWDETENGRAPADEEEDIAP